MCRIVLPLSFPIPFPELSLCIFFAFKERERCRDSALSPYPSMEGIRGPAAAREERKNRARCKNKKLSWRRFLASSLTSPRCCSSPVAPRVLLDGVACILPVVSRGGAAAGRAHRVLGKEKERERERALVLLPLPLPFLFSLFSLSLSELLLSLSLSPSFPSPLDPLGRVSGYHRDTLAETERQRK